MPNFNMLIRKTTSIAPKLLDDREKKHLKVRHFCSKKKQTFPNIFTIYNIVPIM